MEPSLQFVVLRHEGIAEPHFDIMFETSPGSLLATWRSPVWPIPRGEELTPLGDHRREYLTYEGSLTNNRGSVKQVARGECAIAKDVDPLTEWVRWTLTLDVPDFPYRHLILWDRRDGTWRGATEDEP